MEDDSQEPWGILALRPDHLTMEMHSLITLWPFNSAFLRPVVSGHITGSNTKTWFWQPTPLIYLGVGEESEFWR